MKGDVWLPCSLAHADTCKQCRSVLTIYFNNIEFVKLQKYLYINLIITKKKKNMNEQDKKYKTRALVKILFLIVFFFIISLNEKYENAFGHCL
jgi:dipeptide/tripeptide permease